VVAEGCIEGNDAKILETYLEICSKTEKMKGQGLGGRGAIVEITGKHQAGSPRFAILQHCPHPGNEPGLVPHTHVGLLLDWTVGAAVLSGPLLFTGLSLNVQLQPDCIKNSLLKGEFGGVAAMISFGHWGHRGLHAGQFCPQNLDCPASARVHLPLQRGPQRQIFFSAGLNTACAMER